MMLNPSTATEELLDSTVFRCLKRARVLGFDGLSIINLFALRSTDPRGLLLVDDPCGPENDAYILQEAQMAAMGPKMRRG